MTEDAGGWTTGTADSPQGPEHAARQLLPPKATIDVPAGLAIVGLGLLILIAPSLVPGLQPM